MLRLDSTDSTASDSIIAALKTKMVNIARLHSSRLAKNQVILRTCVFWRRLSIKCCIKPSKNGVWYY
jgi:hypothetical protein